MTKHGQFDNVINLKTWKLVMCDGRNIER